MSRRYAGWVPQSHAGTVEAALAFPRARPEIDADRVGLVGHSEGSGIRAVELTLAEDWEALEEHLFESYQAQFGMLPEEGRPPAEQIELLARQTAQPEAVRYQDPWFGVFLRYDPGQDWERVRVPVLAVFAEHDLQVDPELNREPLHDAFERAGNEEASIVTLERANHLFLESDTGDALEYAELEMAFAPGFLELITQWLAEQVVEEGDGIPADPVRRRHCRRPRRCSLRAARRLCRGRHVLRPQRYR